MIRMISNNTSDYVATDLIHCMWCQHAERYDYLFPNEPHHLTNEPCPFNHVKVKQIERPIVDNPDSFNVSTNRANSEVANIMATGNYGNFGKIYDQNQNIQEPKFNFSRKILKPLDLNENSQPNQSNEQQSRLLGGYGNTESEESINLIRKRDGNSSNPNNTNNPNAPSTKV
jgi:hypothetical protein